MVVEASLYESYNFVAFNISRTGGETVTYNDSMGIRIYVPKAPEVDLSMTADDRTYLEGLGLNPDNYEKINLDYTLFAYYFSTNKTNSIPMSAETCTENNLICFLATRLISKEELPVGSVIRLNKGYQFRPERYEKLGVSPKYRGDNSFVGCIVDDAWWETYQYVGFNVSVQGAQDLVSMETGENFVIYVPKA